MRGVVLVVHGLAEHGGRYAEFAEQLNRHGFAVATVDLPGHGRSMGKRCCVAHLDQYLHAVEIAHQATEDEFSARESSENSDGALSSANRPFFLLGHSMGGLIASLYIQKHEARFAGVVFSGAALMSDPVPPAAQVLFMQMLAKVLPAAGVLKIEAEGVSRDPSVVEKYVNDPLVFTGKLPVSVLVAMVKGMKRSVKGLGDVTVPALIMHGEADRVVPVEASRLLMSKIGSKDKELRVFPQMFHEIFNEPERVEIVDQVIDWMQKRLPSQ